MVVAPCAVNDIAVENCAICQLHANPVAREHYEILRSELWVLRHHPDPAPLPGWLLLDSLRHCSGPLDFSEAEAADWGRAVRDTSRLVKQITGCQRVYAIAFGEGPNIFICISSRDTWMNRIPRPGRLPISIGPWTPVIVQQPIPLSWRRW